MFETLRQMLQYSFMQRALVVGVLVALCAALLGVSLVLKRYALIGDGLSHVGFASLSIALALNFAPLMVSIPLVMLSAFLLLRLSERSGLQGDSAIALISASALAIGVVVASLSKGLNVDVSSYMFGSLLAMSEFDVALSVALSLCVIACFVLLYQRIFALTFDESFARATGTRTGLLNTLMAMLTAVTIVVGMRMMGTLLISSLIIFPALTAMRLIKSFLGVVICAGVLSIVCVVLGLCASMLLGVPAGASVVLANLAMFLVFSGIRMIKKGVSI